jgi:hypothetical protein
LHEASGGTPGALGAKKSSTGVSEDGLPPSLIPKSTASPTWRKLGAGVTFVTTPLMTARSYFVDVSVWTCTQMTSVE